MNLYEKIGLLATVSALVILTAVGAAANRSDGGVAPASESEKTVKTDGTDQNAPILSNFDGAENGNLLPLAPPDSQEILEFLPGRPSFLKPAFGLDDPVSDGFSEGNDSPTLPAETTDVPETENLPDVQAPAVSPAVETTTETTTDTTPATTPENKPVTQQKPEIPTEPEIPDTASLRERMVEIAESQIGIEEDGENNIKYNTWYYGRKITEPDPDEVRYGWCVVFLSWCADRAEVPASVFPKMAGVSALQDFFADQGRYFQRGDYTPQPGDVVFFRHSHVGIVVSVDGDTLTLVEGNYADKVALTTYDIDDSKLSGFGSPKY